MKFRLSAALAAIVFGVSSYAVAGTAEASQRCGRASWYALHSKTASGERMNPAKLTAAHRSLHFGTKLRVTNMRNGKSVIVRVNDRGPFIRGRVLDLSRGAARSISMVGAGVTKVCYDIIR